MVYPKTLSLLVYPCTIVGYIRLALLISAVSFHLLAETELWRKTIIVGLLGSSCLLDGVDGYLARRYGHTSDFGTLFDLTIDLSTHTISWYLSEFYLAMPLLILEWSTGLYIAAFSMYPGDSWKNVVIKKGPFLFGYYFSNHQRNLLSAYGNISHFALPMALYLQLPISWVYYSLWPGLILYELVTLYLLYIFIKILVTTRQ
jgi:CDP-diacylglycerol--inositol 3-phosphatidyltransferase